VGEDLQSLASPGSVARLIGFVGIAALSSRAVGQLA